MTVRSFNRCWALLWLTAASAIVAVVSIEPMRWSLPARYLLKPLDIYRIGAIDYHMCMRVELSPEEADDFVRRRFDPKDRIVRPVPSDQHLCGATFWPTTFNNETSGYAETQWSNGIIEGSTGAVYERNALYFWSWTQ